MSLWAGLFQHHRREATPAARRTYARFEIAHTIVDFLAAAFFIIGSIMFFSDAWQTIATWFFTIGSFLFAAKPSLKLWREIKLYRLGKLEPLAKRER